MEHAHLRAKPDAYYIQISLKYFYRHSQKSEGNAENCFLLKMTSVRRVLKKNVPVLGLTVRSFLACMKGTDQFPLTT